NKADSFCTVHRVTQHPTDWMVTEFHVRKMKDTDTGGRVTPFDSPVKFEMYKGGCAFVERIDGIGLGVDPVVSWHKRNSPKQGEIVNKHEPTEPFNDGKIIEYDEPVF